MTAHDPKARLVGAAKEYLGPVARRLGVTREMLELAPGQRAQMAALLEQALRAQERLEAYIDRIKEEQAAQAADVEAILLAARSIVDALGSEHGPAGAGDALTGRLDHAMNHADAQAARTRLHVDRELAALRGTVRLTQSLVERALDGPGGDGPAGIESVTPTPITADERVAAPRKQFSHDVPTFDSLYRAFEDRHRGDPEAILDRQRDDYLELLAGLPNPELPIVDLGCGRGELVGLLQTTGHEAVGVDSNLGQVVDATGGTFHQGDLFDWLDQQDDASCRAVVSMHVVEHLPLDLQIRLVFEAHRVLADGGALVLETPNTLSLNIGASNFWVDPTHERPVHPLFLEFLAIEAGFAEHETRFLHPIPLTFPSNEATAALVADLDSLILGPGDLALVARR
jgi:SAM-dependent methyltransferase